ncbi:60S ribosomal protein L29 [Coemansia aciculifera]|uniref:60S ribosomal protein L29 n=3 Tax=Coemansia TaxID=4863 RepID=A0A9W8M8Z9_9FUNG|nr:60S ribosomal protein L29 [Coemansia aciculifera]
MMGMTNRYLVERVHMCGSCRITLLFRRTVLVKMSKTKNHTNHNQNKKAHRNGIKKPKTYRHPSLKGVCPKFLRNQRFAKRGTLLAGIKAKVAAKAAAVSA